MHPLISICIPTYNRADLLDYCLENLATGLKDIGRPLEIVISDNGSTDRTPEVIEAHRARNPMIRAYRMTENRGGAANWLNAMYKSEGEFLAYLADDDSLVAEGFINHIERLEREPDLVAIYADWIAWNDKEECEIHRHYNGLTEFTSFAPSAPLELINYMLKRFYPPEIGVYRRDAMLRAHAFQGRSLPHYLTMYRLSRQGRIAFDPLPFYREHRLLKDRFQRTHWANMAMQYHMIGDELRLSLEEMVLMGMQDAGASHLNAEQAQIVRQSIDRILHMRLQLEVDRACARQDWITAVELRRRHVLWHGPGSEADTRRDALKIIIPAALQAVRQTFTSLSGATGISLRGFESSRISDFYRDQFPETPVYPLGDRSNGAATLIVHRDEQTLSEDASIHDPADVMVLERLLNVYRITQARIDLKGL